MTNDCTPSDMTTEIRASLRLWRSYVKWAVEVWTFLLEDAREIALIPYLILGQLLETTNILSLEDQRALASFWLLVPGPLLSSPS